MAPEKQQKYIYKFKQFLKRGNKTKIIVKDEKGDTLVYLPATVVAAGVLVAPLFSAVVSAFAIYKDCTIEINQPE